MEHDPRTFLWDARNSADAILQFTGGREYEQYSSDAMMRAAVERHFEIIGEALNRLLKTHPQVAAKIPDLARAVAFRNLLIHGYATVDDTIVWRTVQTDLPVLREAVAAQLGALGEPPDEKT
jgi:uncharacterized protein with HEPN domain